MFRQVGIAVRLTVLIVVGTGLLVGLLSYYDYHHARSVVEAELRERAVNLSRATANEMEVVSRAVEKIVSEVVILLRQSEVEEHRLEWVLRDTLEAHVEVDGIGILLEYGEEGPRMPFAWRKDGGIAFEDIVRESDYPYWEDDWYQFAVHLGGGWSEPYYGSISQRLRVTYAEPLYGVDGERIGVVEADVDLEWLTERIQSLQVGEYGKGFVTSANGTFIAYPEREFLMRESLFSIARESDRPRLAELGRRMQAGESGFVPVRGFREERSYWLAYTGIAATGWSMGVLFDQKELYARLMELVRGKLLYGGLCGLALLGMALLIARSISEPIRKLEGSARGLATGNLDTPVEAVKGSDEVARLTQSFVRMRDDLKGHIAALQVATEKQARIDSDLAVAREIQMGTLPAGHGIKDGRCAVAAKLEPAREVGGDFYDYGMLDADHLYVAVGDASGKGVSAALFVVLVRTLLKGRLLESGPGEALAQTNDELARENETMMFATVFAAVLDLRSGRMRYANGGHNPPYVRRANGQWEMVPELQGGVVGPMEGMRFEEGELDLRPGDELIGYTDGITEAEDGVGFFGEERLEACLGGEATVEERVESVVAAVGDFRGNYAQSDDVTVLALQWRGA